MAIQVRQDFQLTVATTATLTAMTKKRIYYKKPRSTSAEYIDATVYDTTSLRANITKATNSQEGTWAFQAFCEDADGKQYWGSVANLTVNKNL